MNKIISFNLICSKELEPGLLPYSRFSTQGGVIGSELNADWRLNDIHAQQCRILWLDDRFCIEDLCGEVFLNQSSMPVGCNLIAGLNENDEISIGSYKIRVSLGSDSSLSVDEQLSSTFNEEKLFDLTSSSMDDATADIKPEVLDDPLEALDALKKVGEHEVLNFNTILDTQQNMALIDSSPLNVGKELTMQAGSDYTQDSAIALKNKTDWDNFMMDEKNLDLLESELHSELDIIEQPHMSGNHLTTGPLLRGLGVQIGDVRDSNKMQAISMDLGAALKAAITGILSLHSKASQGRYQLMNKNLQPIEDNPLRLGLSYEETIKTLFDDGRSFVHLSSEAAITESLRSIEHHNDAVQTAIAEALEYILMAFSPETLLKRFKQYRKSSDTSLETGDKWAWTMYEKYYAELTSNRQKGFEKLFWEIFEQAYDRKLRELQRNE